MASVIQNLSCSKTGKANVAHFVWISFILHIPISNSLGFRKSWCSVYAMLFWDWCGSLCNMICHICWGTPHKTTTTFTPPVEWTWDPLDLRTPSSDFCAWFLVRDRDTVVTRQAGSALMTLLVPFGLRIIKMGLLFIRIWLPSEG